MNIPGDLPGESLTSWVEAVVVEDHDYSGSWIELACPAIEAGRFSRREKERSKYREWGNTLGRCKRSEPFRESGKSFELFFREGGVRKVAPYPPLCNIYTCREEYMPPY